MNRLIPALAAACLSLAAATAMAQSPSGDAGKPYGGPRHGLRNCSEAADPAKCEAERKARYERVKEAREACKDRPDSRGCMTEQYCAKEQDPAQCQARAKERHARLSRKLDQRQAIAEACTGKRGDALQQCYRDQRPKRGGPGAGKPAQ